MKLNLPTLAAHALLPAVLLMFAGCSSTPKVDRKISVAYRPGVPGGSMVETYQTSARVIAINPGTRQMTFIAPDGSTNTFRAGPKFLSFDSYHVGDTVNVTVAREVTMYLADEAPPVTASAAAAARSTPGAEPGVLTTETKQLTATVSAVDVARQEATLQISDGRTGTFHVRKDIDLTQVKLGTAVIIRTSSALAVMLERP